METYQYTYIKKYSNGDFAFDVYEIDKKPKGNEICISYLVKNGRKATKKDKEKALYWTSNGTA